MDIADAIEETRKLKRALCSEDLGLTPEEVFEGDFLDYSHFSRLRLRLENHLGSNRHPRGLELVASMRRLECIRIEDLAIPTVDELCTRYSKGSLDARTVLHITGWTLDELYDACSQRGVAVPL